MHPNLLMQVEKSVNLTGLGVLVIAQQGTPLLECFDLHMHCLVRLVFPDGGESEASASIEAISRPINSQGAMATETPALLLTHETLTVPTGTLVYWLEQTE
ncbi:hypothetical protein [uncultured Hymenobacter sp.]|uniref:hypothetical protein n=1 Tax=uncultured Hymenobacter sp. TaxID=170016 RepID=UPI0035CA6558